MNEYLKKAIKEVETKNQHEPEFLQAVKEVLSTVEPILDKHSEYEKLAILERITEPERIITFRVPWTNDNGDVVDKLFYHEFDFLYFVSLTFLCGHHFHVPLLRRAGRSHHALF